MDLAMPSLNGIEATQQIKRDYPETRIVILSGLTDEEQSWGIGLGSRKAFPGSALL